MKNILIADDERITRSLLVSIVESRGHVASQFSDGERAMHFLNDGNHVDLIITDMAMPNVDGRQFIQNVKRNKYCIDIPIIIISGVVSIREINDLLALGVSYFVPKPIERPLLEEYIVNVLQPRLSVRPIDLEEVIQRESENV